MMSKNDEESEKNIEIQELIKEDNLLTLSKQEWKDFQEILETPQKPTVELRELMKLKGFDYSI